MERGMKKARDTKKTKSESENTGHSQQCVGERLDRDTKKASEKNKARSENMGYSQRWLTRGWDGQGHKKSAGQ